ncbi:MAG: M48 family metallopeptidase [Dehalococcoidales bacterium]|nr:M48 family metallopeptidase [Dehalococcoidales bacterium]
MWEQIRSNQIRSAILVIGMGVLLFLIGYFLGLYFFDSGIGGLVIAIILWAIMTLLAYFQGDSILLASAGAKKISHDDHPRLYNIVEEMRIASGLPKTPDIYIIDDPSLNAFATGRDPNKAAVAITSGLLQQLNRDELQGVMAHEISHIKNRDVLLMAMTSVLLGTIVMLSWYGSRIMIFGGGGSRRDSSSGGAAQGIIMLIALLLMILAPIFAQLIYFAISRKREYLADASAAMYTRYPEGLASALEKLGASSGQLKSANQATAPMYIVNPFRKKGRAATDFSSTHPPISERVRILRAMGGGASYIDYEKAYKEVHRGRGSVIPASAMSLTGSSSQTVLRPSASDDPGRLERTRETSDVMWKLSNYKTIDCPCGTKLRIPPHFSEKRIQCPHCGINHTI